MENKFRDIEDYGIIGNLETCALVGNDGSIDWLCFPYHESPSVFAAILDDERGGRFAIRPASKYDSVQYYMENTNILQTMFNTPFGILQITDFMPVKSDDYTDFHRSIYRKIECLKGYVKLQIDFQPRFNYAKSIPDFELVKEGINCSNGAESLLLSTEIPLAVNDQKVVSEYDMRENDISWFILYYNSNNQHISHDNDFNEGILQNTKKYWQEWTHKCTHHCVLEGIWHDIVVRSGLVLKLLASPKSGAIAAAPTSSLPEIIGGVRNWDYRYAWIRDSAYTTQALFHLDHVEESADYMRWISNIIEQDVHPSDMKIMYPLHKEVDISEKILEYLSGYRNSSPVRIGNGAFNQKQFDIYGELINAIYDTARYGKDISDKTWSFIKDLVDYVCEVWDTKDRGIWEIRDEPRHYVYSKLMCWVAIDRGLKIAKFKEPNSIFDNWKKTEKEIGKAILEKGFNKKLNSFVQYFNSGVIDATTLLIPYMGFLHYDDPMVRGTIDAVMENLMTEDGFVYRYKNEDGLPGDEGCFALCSFWLIKSLALSGRLEEAERNFINVLKLISPLGLLSEEIDPKTGQLLGNFPQAYSHIGLINSALYIGVVKGRAHKGPKPQGIKHSVRK